MCEIIRWKTPSYKNNLYWDNENGYNWLRIRDLIKNNYNTNKKITKFCIKKFQLPITDNKSLLLTRLGTIECFLIDNKKFYFSDMIIDIKVIENKIIREFLFYWLKINIPKIKNLYKSAIMINFTNSIIKNLNISLPPLQKQIEILNYLHPFYTKLNSLSKKIESLINNYDNLYKRISNSIINKEVNRY